MVKLNWLNATKQQKIDFLNEATHKKLTFRQAVLLVDNASRNALIGFSGRNRGEVLPPAHAAHRPSGKRKLVEAPVAAVVSQGERKKVKAPKRGTVEAPMSAGVRLLDRRRNQCSWIDGESKVINPLMCGEVTHGETPYCAYHASLAYQPQADKRPRGLKFQESGLAHSVRVR